MTARPDRAWLLAMVRRLLADAKRRQVSGVWLSVEELEAVLSEKKEQESVCRE